ncbi:LysR substrate-binding domain-containing protein [Cereibacter sphaeroides]|uniref:LysR substrate-binding domain-containing protein n=1 Tax=Cereibacter sphaeroides TaxID=1063 RepID=UPI000191CA0A|nr:LysR substrate-binding domain-containing protein [Cereibacter sphaeroides]ACM04188.1 LysR family transcriptional regulatory protein [Cereibacter sphaeroides KD131]
MLQTRHFRYFLAVAEELNFHRAAERLNLSQPALWRQIRDLEAEMGTPLLEREPRGISLTRAGAAFLEDCRDILERVENARLRARRIVQGELGTLHIGFNEIAGRRPEMPRFLQAFRRAFPEVSLQLHFLMSQLQVDALRGGSLDAGFLLRPRGERSDFQTLRIGEDDYALALPRDHPLTRREGIRLTDLSDQALILPNPRNNAVIYDRLMTRLRDAGVSARIAQFADNENTIMNLVDAGMGLAFLNLSFRPPEASGVVLRPLADLTMPVDLELVWRGANANPALAHLVELVRTQAEASPA